jgi:hypothetical protein
MGLFGRRAYQKDLVILIQDPVMSGAAVLLVKISETGNSWLGPHDPLNFWKKNYIRLEYYITSYDLTTRKMIYCNTLNPKILYDSGPNHEADIMLSGI